MGDLTIDLYLIFEEHPKTIGIQYLQSSWSRNPYISGVNRNIGDWLHIWEDDWELILNQRIQEWRGSLMRPQFMIFEGGKKWKTNHKI